MTHDISFSLVATAYMVTLFVHSNPSAWIILGFDHKGEDSWIP